MSDSRSTDSDFLDQVILTIGENMHDEQFGVTELADKMNMSRSNLLLKIKKAGNISVNQLIKETRLKRGMELLQETSMNVSEVSHKIGFNSASYFIKCFREQYGYPPGEVGKRNEQEPEGQPEKTGRRMMPVVIGIISIAILIVISVTLLYPSKPKIAREKSVLVLPFKNDSNDSTNVYLINGLMESTLNNLQKIEDLRVLSRTSAEKYRNANLSIPEMARELNVSYFVEGSGQKIGDQILLNIQLIDGPTDKHLWAKQYRREAKDIFELQHEVAKNIAQEIQAIITPDEQQRIEKKPTENLVAYDLYLKGAHEWTRGNRNALTSAIPYFKQAVEEDDEFALAYAALAISYYYMDIFQIEKKFTAELNSYSDKAMLLDPTNSTCLMSRALYYIHQQSPEQAIPYLDKALKYNPNNAQVLNFLSDIYNIYRPNTSKHLYNALKVVRLNVGSLDSATASFNYMHLAAAFVQAGFTKESQVYLEKAYAYNPDNPYLGWLRGAIMITVTGDYEPAKQIMIQDYNKDTTRIQVLQEIGKLEYAQGNYDAAYKCFKRFNWARDAYGLDIFRSMDLTIGIVYHEVGKKEEGDRYIKNYLEFANADKTMYKELHLGLYYSWMKDDEKALEHFQEFAKQDDFQYWVLLLGEDDLTKDIKLKPEFKKVLKTITDKFWANNKKMRKQLEEEGLL